MHRREVRRIVWKHKEHCGAGRVRGTGDGRKKRAGCSATSGPSCLRCVLRRVEILKMFAANLEYIFIITIFRGGLLRIHGYFLKKSHSFYKRNLNIGNTRFILLKFLEHTFAFWDVFCYTGTENKPCGRCPYAAAVTAGGRHSRGHPHID